MMWPPTGSVLTDCIPGLDSAELVQRGGQKAVYKATIEGQIVALKVMSLESDETYDEDADADMSATLERAQREVAILEEVDVPVLTKRGPLGLSKFNIGTLQCICFTEEWIEGITLRDMISTGRLSPDQVAKLGVDLVSAVCWLSARGIIHRDIKPENVMWDPDRSGFVLLDPGTALDLYGPSITRVPFPVGTMVYFSPEQMDVSRKRSLDFRSDLFAVGLVMYEAAVAEHPFMSANTTVPQVLLGIRDSTPQPVDQRMENFPAALSDAITRLLGKSPHLRFRRCDLAYEAIKEIAVSMGVEV